MYLLIDILRPKENGFIILLFAFNMYSSVFVYADETGYEQTAKIAEQKALEFSGGSCGKLLEVRPLLKKKKLCINVKCEPGVRPLHQENATYA